jgi:hypothetical protein
MRHATSALRHAALLAGALLIVGCSRTDPAGPIASLTPLVQHDGLELRASFLVPPGRGRADSIIVEVSMHNASAATRRIATTPGCEVAVRLLSAAAGAGASATFYDDFQRPCVRMLREIVLRRGETEVVRHAIPMQAITRAAPRHVQAHVGVLIDGGVVLLTGGTFMLP